MSYNYQQERGAVFTEQGQRMFLKMRDWCKKALLQSGAVRTAELMGAAGSGNSFTMLACIDRMVELGELREVTPPGVAGQYRVYVEGRL